MALLDYAPSSRIAPTPSGYLHAGNAVSFALTWALVRAHGGRLRLRIDDLDAPRMRPEFVEDVFVQLEWLGLDWDEGPTGPDDHARNHSQRLRLDRYREALRRLVEDERAGVFGCGCSRSKVRAPGSSGLYDGTCRGRGLDPFADENSCRVPVPAGCEARFRELTEPSGEATVRLDLALGDFIIKRRDGFPGYHLVSLVDDVDYGTDLVVRGVDLRDSTAAQSYLARFVPGGERFARAAFVHHPLLPDPRGGKLSKSRDSSPLRELRERWRDPEPVFRAAGETLGREGIRAREELVRLITEMSSVLQVSGIKG